MASETTSSQSHYSCTMGGGLYGPVLGKSQRGGASWIHTAVGCSRHVSSPVLSGSLSQRLQRRPTFGSLPCGASMAGVPSYRWWQQSQIPYGNDHLHYKGFWSATSYLWRRVARQRWTGSFSACTGLPLTSGHTARRHGTHGRCGERASKPSSCAEAWSARRNRANVPLSWVVHSHTRSCGVSSWRVGSQGLGSFWRTTQCSMM
mmetsp:Transcript_59634/g.164840  ORF Transcript_59634/g.164840 Transcript_59634/m.164840 type:complete len:204 (+) Transcript_59634:492-1103(+)